MSDLILGAGGSGGKGGSKPYVSSTAQDGLDSVQYAKVIDLISEGEIQGLKDGNKSIYINNTPLQNPDGSYNFQNVTVYTTTGTQGQAAIPISNDIESEVGVGITVLNSLPVIKSITKPNVDAARITISIPQLQGFTDKGDITGASVQLKIAVQYAGGGFATVIDDTIEGRSGDLYQKEYIINFTGSTPVDIRVTRVTADSTDPKLVNAFSWASYTEITYAKLRYPNSALVGLQINAEQFSSIPTRSYLIRGIKVKIPSNATVDSNNGRLIYSGTWNGTFGAASWTTDPCWILWDLLTSTRYGFGDQIKAAQLDKWAFYSSSLYCSQLVPSGFNSTESTSLPTTVVTNNQTYKTITGVSSSLLSLDVYHFGTGTLENRPVVVYIHGGAWALGDKANIDYKASFFNNLGYIFVSVNYRLSPSQIIPYSSFSASRVKHPNHISDCASAIAWVYNNIGNYGGDETQIVLVGHSAGAHLASLLATNQSYLNTAGVTINKIKGCISVDTDGYDVYKQIADPVSGGESSNPAQTKYFYQNAFGIYPDATISGAGTIITTDFANTTAALAAYSAASPIANLSSSTPQFLVFMRGDSGRIARESEFLAALRSAAVPYTSVTYDGSTTYTHSEINKSIGSVNDPPNGPSSLPPGTANVSTQIANWLTRIAPTNPPPTTTTAATPAFEPRFSCNCSIQTQDDAFKLINDLSSVFRAQSYWNVGSLTVSQDKPTDPTYLFTLANVAEGGFSYQNSSKKIRPTVVVVSYLDLTTRDIAYEAVEDTAAIAKYGVITTQISAFACTSRGQASRIGKWLLFAENYESEIVSFTASIEAGVLVRPGQVIEIADPMRAGSRRGGRISSATTTVITVDDATGLTVTNSPTLSVILNDGTVQTRSVTAIAGKAITVSSAFTSAPLANSIWVFESTDLLTSTWRVLSVAEQDDCQYAVTAIAFNSSKYAYIEDGTPLKFRDTTNLNAIPATPTNLAISETLYTYQNQVRAKVVVSWKSVMGVNQYEVRWRKDLGNWTLLQQPSVDFQVLDITPGTFNFKIYSLNAAGKPSSTALSGSIAALGKTAPPSNVTTFTAALDPDVGVTLNWSSVTDLDLQGYEIWQGAAWGSGTKLGLFSATSKKLGLIGAGTTTWWIKALDTSGSYSTTATSASLTITAAGAPTISGVFSNDSLILSWTAVAGSLSTAYYEVRYGTVSSTWGTATVLGTMLGTTYPIKGAWVGTRRFFVAAVDLKGNVGTSATYDAVVTAPSQPTVSQQVIDNNVLLQWTDATQTLPIMAYELRKGSTWASAMVIGTKQGKFTTVFESSSGTYTYWLAGIDSANNYGTPGSINAQVNQPPDYVLKLNQDSTFSGTKTNLTTLDVGLLASVNTTETWQSHFTSRSWTTPQDQINAGYPYFAMPSTTTGQYYEDINYGAVLAGTKVTTTLTSNVITGATTITPTISVKKLIGDAWTVYAGVNSVYATNFQYVRAQYDFTSTGGDDLLQITGLNVRLDSKLRNDSGTGTANSGDSGGTTVNFNIAFVDVDSISVTPLTTSAVMAVYDFVDVNNPSSFKVLLFNTSGTRVSGTFSWSARGI